MTAKWTFLVYMAGDNNLEDAGRADLGEMQRVGSTRDVNVLVQFDTEEQRTMRYRIEKGRANAVQSMRGVDCGDPKVLTEFINWGAEKYPAEHYALVVWNHGGGWEDADVDYEANRLANPFRAGRLLRARRSVFRTTGEKIARLMPHERLIAIDCGAQDYLDNQELRRALENAEPKIELLGCDACLMNMVEIAFEMKDTAKFMVGSEETEPGSGWPYTEILSALTAEPGMPVSDLATCIVDNYADWYRQHGVVARDGAASQSAIDLSKVEELAGAIDALAKVLIADLPSIADQIAYARSRTLQFEIPDYIDLGDFTGHVMSRLKRNAKVVSAAEQLQKALRVATTRSATWGSLLEPATGISIFFPQGRNSRLISQYRDLRFGRDNSWTDFLEAYLAGD